MQNLNWASGPILYNEAVMQLQAFCAKQFPDKGDPAALANLLVAQTLEHLAKTFPLPLVPMVMLLGTAMGAFCAGNAGDREGKAFSETQLFEMLDLMAYSAKVTLDRIQKPKIVLADA